jgi:hypothetical protein
MKPQKNKTYKIAFYPNNPTPEIQEMTYEGLAKCIADGAVDEDENGDPLYLFEMPDNILQSYFGEDDIVEEVTLTSTE